MEELWQRFAEAEGEAAVGGCPWAHIGAAALGGFGGGEAGQGERDACEDRGCDPGPSWT